MTEKLIETKTEMNFKTEISLLPNGSYKRNTEGCSQLILTQHIYFKNVLQKMAMKLLLKTTLSFSGSPLLIFSYHQGLARAPVVLIKNFVKSVEAGKIVLVTSH